MGQLQLRRLHDLIAPPEQVEIEGAGPPGLQALAAELGFQGLQALQQLQGPGLQGRHPLHQQYPIEIGGLAGGAAHRLGAKQGRPAQADRSALVIGLGAPLLQQPLQERLQ